MLENKSGNISETRKDRRKVTMDGHRNSPTLFRTVPSPTPYGLPFPKIGGSQPHAKLQPKISGKRMLIDDYFNMYGGPLRAYRNCTIGTKSHKKFEKSSPGRTQGVPKFFRAPIYRAHCAVVFAIAHAFLLSIGVY